MRLYKLMASLEKSNKPSLGRRLPNFVACVSSCGVKVIVPASIFGKQSLMISLAILLTLMKTSKDVSVKAISNPRWSTISPSSAFSVMR